MRPSTPPLSVPAPPRPALSQLPRELLGQVLAELPTGDQAHASETCYELRRASLDPRLDLRRQAVLAGAHDAYQAVLPERRRQPKRHARTSVVLPERRRVLHAALQRHLGEVGPELFARDASRWLAPGAHLPRSVPFRGAFFGQLERTLARSVPSFAAFAAVPSLLSARQILAVLGATGAQGAQVGGLQPLAAAVRARLDKLDLEALRERSAGLCLHKRDYVLGGAWTLVASRAQLTRYDAMSADANWATVADALGALLPLGEVGVEPARRHGLYLLAECLGDADVAALTQAGSAEAARRRRQVIVALLRDAFASRKG